MVTTAKNECRVICLLLFLYTAHYSLLLVVSCTVFSYIVIPHGAVTSTIGK